MELEFSGRVWFWKGPAPWFFVPVPEAESEQLASVSRLVTYGWGMVPVTAAIGDTRWETSLFPKDGGYLVPLRVWVRKAEGIDEDDVVTVRLSVAS